MNSTEYADRRIRNWLTDGGRRSTLETKKFGVSRESDAIGDAAYDAQPLLRHDGRDDARRRRVAGLTNDVHVGQLFELDVADRQRDAQSGAAMACDNPGRDSP